MTIPEYVKAYESTVADIEFMWYETALEADSDTNIDDEQAKKARGMKISDKLKQIIDHLLAMIEKVVLSITNALQRVNLTDKGFKKELREAELGVQPLNAIRVITYQYIDQVLDGEYQKITAIINRIVGSISSTNMKDIDNERNPLNMDNKELEAYILREMKCPSEITDMTIYFSYLKKIFRGKKMEMQISKDALPRHKKLVVSYDSFKDDVNRNKATMFNQISQLKNTLKIINANLDNPDATKMKIARQMKNVSLLYNMYGTFLGSMFQLKVEQMLNSRIILKRFYQF